MPVLQGNFLGAYDPPLKLRLVSVAGWHAERSPWKCSSDSLHVFGRWCLEDGWLPCLRDCINLVKYALLRKLLSCKHHLAGRNPSPDTGFESLRSGVNNSYT